jgi:hypothetical protein
MPPFVGTSTNNLVSAVTATPYSDTIVKHHSAVLTHDTCETTVLTNTGRSTSSSSSSNDTETAIDGMDGMITASTSAFNCTPMTTTTTLDSPGPNQQQPRRNLNKAFEALCITPDDETLRKEEKSDVFDDMPTMENNAALVSPLSDGAVDAVSTAQMNGDSNPRVDTPSSVSTNPSTVGVQQPLFTTVTPNIPVLPLHPELRLKLSPFTVERVSCYSIVHDINKEAVTMAAHDPMQNIEMESVSPLVIEGRGTGQVPTVPGTAPTTASVPTAVSTNTVSNSNINSAGTDTPTDYAIIDEEKWLLESIANRSSQETATNTSTQCPATFLQAMGEKEYDLTTPSNVTSSTTAKSNIAPTTTSVTRTQLWKPSRSWWEAKSGKNPWIEPSSHNKRWRYLWPLIHYHKFVHKCIKKLKRNGVDVKVSVSPVSVFLREEVCAISDHLATVSLFGSEEWMDCLIHFNGWTDMSSSAAVLQYQMFVQSLPLRSLQEQLDVDSPLLRDQIDAAFLRMIALQRDSSTMMYYPQNTPSVDSGKITRNQPGNTTATTNTTATAATTNAGAPPIHSNALNHPHHLYRHNPLPVPRHINGLPRSRYYTNGWYPGNVHPGWENLPIDSSSVHSELSANSYPQLTHHHNFIDTATVAAQAGHYHMYPSSASALYYQYPHPVPTPSHSAATMGPSAASEASHSTGYTYPDQYCGWMDPAMAAYAVHSQYYSSPSHYYGVDPSSTSSAYPSPPGLSGANKNNDEEQPETSESSETEEVNEGTVDTPYKYNQDQSFTMQSPYWSHLDQATLAMGLATPAAMISPASTPRRTAAMCRHGTGTCRKGQSQSLRGSTVTEDEASTTLTETEDEYPIGELDPYSANLYPHQGQYHVSEKNFESGAHSHVNYFSTLNHPNTAATTAASSSIRYHGIPPSPATQFMMSPQVNFAYTYGYGISPARIPSRRSGNHTTRHRPVGTSSTSVDLRTNTNEEHSISDDNEAMIPKNHSAINDARVSSTMTNSIAEN